MMTEEIITLILIAIGLSFDSFAVSISCGAAKTHIRFLQASKIGISLALFQGLLPVLGWFIGYSIQDYIQNADHWIAFVLLFALGLKMAIDSLHKDESSKVFDPLKLYVILTISLATSIDAFIVGVSFGFLDLNIILASVIIFSVTYFFSMLGILFGKKLGKKLGPKMELAGGIILILIGIKILTEHLGYLNFT